MSTEGKVTYLRNRKVVAVRAFDLGMWVMDNWPKISSSTAPGDVTSATEVTFDYPLEEYDDVEWLLDELYEWLLDECCDSSEDEAFLARMETFLKGA